MRDNERPKKDGWMWILLTVQVPCPSPPLPLSFQPLTHTSIAESSSGLNHCNAETGLHCHYKSLRASKKCGILSKLYVRTTSYRAS